MKYRRKEQVEAIQFTGSNKAECMAFCPTAGDTNQECLWIPWAHADGHARADVGNWIVRDSNGVYWVATEAWFQKMYAPVEESAALQPVRCRIAVATGAGGWWCAYGQGSDTSKTSDEDNISDLEDEFGELSREDTVVWVEANVPIPQPVEPAVIRGTVVKQGETG